VDTTTLYELNISRRIFLLDIIGRRLLDPVPRRTTVRVLADPRVLVIGVTCEDDPDGIVSFSVSRDAGMQAEDHVRIALGPFRDGRSGYVFAVNPRGARYDSLITAGGDAESVEWDGIWEAATASTSNARSPLSSLEPASKSRFG
jgi:hypothetical protein